MRHLKSYVIALVAMLLVGCATAPRNPQQSLAVVDAQFTGFVMTATDLVKSGTIHGKDAQHVKQLADQGNKALDTAWQLQGQGKSYKTPLDAVIAVNQALQTILNNYAAQIKKAQSPPVQPKGA